MQIQMKASPAEEMCVCMGAQAHTDQTAVAVVANLHFQSIILYFPHIMSFGLVPVKERKRNNSVVKSSVSVREI